MQHSTVEEQELASDCSMPLSIMTVNDNSRMIMPLWIPFRSEAQFEELNSIVAEFRAVLFSRPVSTAEPNFEEWFVPSSKGDTTYRVVCNDGVWQCGCPGFGFRRTCKHVIQIQLSKGQNDQE